VKETTLTIGGIFSLLCTVVLTTGQVLPAYAGTTICSSDLDCLPGVEICSEVFGICVPFVCMDDGDCFPGNICDAGRCVLTCSTDDDCRPGEVCEVNGNRNGFANENGNFDGNFNGGICTTPAMIGGTMIPIDSTALLLAGIQTNFTILTALVAVGAGAFGAVYYTAKRKH